jgi:hypothetical protein
MYICGSILKYFIPKIKYYSIHQAWNFKMKLTLICRRQTNVTPIFFNSSISSDASTQLIIPSWTSTWICTAVYAHTVTPIPYYQHSLLLPPLIPPPHLCMYTVHQYLLFITFVYPIIMAAAVTNSQKQYMLYAVSFHGLCVLINVVPSSYYSYFGRQKWMFTCCSVYCTTVLQYTTYLVLKYPSLYLLFKFHTVLGALLITVAVRLIETSCIFRFKGTVWRDLRGVKSGINQ